MNVWFDYATPSVLESTRDEALIGLTANQRRPVRFHAKLTRNPFLFRVAMRAFGQIIWSSDSWYSSGDTLDPIITVHPDALVFEAFSRDQSVYAQVKLAIDQFEVEGEVKYGTTNVDFTAWLWAALGELRSHRETWLRIDKQGFEVATRQAGGRFEKKVDVPDAWVRGFLNLQQALLIPGPRVHARPVDLLAPIRFLRYAKCRISPRALRYEFEPGQPVRLLLEPWEKAFLFKGSTHHYTELKTIRNWGRRRLALIEPLLPFATDVEIFLKGRSMPAFYLVRLPGMTFTLGLSGVSDHAWTDLESFSASAAAQSIDSRVFEAAFTAFQSRSTLSLAELESESSIARQDALAACSRLCRRGQLTFDLDNGKYRFRKLVDAPVDEQKIFPPSRRFELALKRVQEEKIRVVSCDMQETRKQHTFKTPEGKLTREVIHRDHHVCGEAVGTGAVEIVVKDNTQIIFGRCQCQQFSDHLLSQGPCEEMISLFLASSDQRRDLPVADEALGPRPPSKRKLREQSEEQGGGDDVDGEESDGVEEE
ncbi:MAG TPA: hypothetical protein PKO06_05125 [Candidatus Ozemobacteraceae bacterium]|nr:hypothetical protein [Candidatus Ozemobacteraceae bacterium]